MSVTKKKVRKTNPTASNLVTLGSSYSKIVVNELKEKIEDPPDIPIPASEYTDTYTEYLHECTESDTESVHSFSSSVRCLEIDEEEHSTQYSFISSLNQDTNMFKKHVDQTQLQFDEYEEE